MPVFLTLGSVGFILLVISLVFDHHHDFDHGDLSLGDHGDHDDGSGPRLLSLKVVAAFLAAFGFAGAIARYGNFSMMASSLVATASGFFLGAVAYKLLGLVYRQQASSHITQNDVLRQKGIVTVAIRGDQPGEVNITVKGSQYSYVARSLTGDSLKEGAPVEIVKFLGESVLVRPAQLVNH